MHSGWLLVVMGTILLLPGLGAVLALFPPGTMSPVTRAAGVFGLGFAAAGGLALALAAAHVFWPATYLVLWGVMTALVWAAALRRRPLRAELRALLGEFGHGRRLALLLGAAVVVTVFVAHLPYLHYLGASRAVYYLNGLEIANAHGVPAATLEYGQSWPPATDKILLDSFTGVIAMLGHNVAAGPGVLDLLDTLGAALGLWALSWELGMRRVGALLPLVMLDNWRRIPGVGITTLFWEYRAEDFGTAVALCAVALGIHAFRRRQLAPAVATGLVLAAASGSHLIPVVAAVIMLSFAALAEMVRCVLPALGPRLATALRRSRPPTAAAHLAPAQTNGRVGVGAGHRTPESAWAVVARGPAREVASSQVPGISPPTTGSAGSGSGGRSEGENPTTPPADEGGSSAPARRDADQAARAGSPLLVLRQGTTMAGLLGGLFVVIRLVAGGSFGLTGASNPAEYSAIPVPFDPTDYLFSGQFRPRLTAPSHWYSIPHLLVAMTAVERHKLPLPIIEMVFAAALVIALVLVVFARGPIRTSGMVGLGLSATVIAAAIAFDYRYQVWVVATFGVRRLVEFVSFGLVLVALAVVEGLVALLGRGRPLRALVPTALVVSLCIWLVPGSNGWSVMAPVSSARVQFFDWVRQDTSCGTRFLVNQRTEGAMTALSGRYAILEGMGSFLRIRTMDYVVHLMLSARDFFESPLKNEAFLRRHRIDYVVIARGLLVLGYPGPTGTTNVLAMDKAPFLEKISESTYFIVYKVRGATPAPVSPLLTGPYLHCKTAPLHF